MMTMKDMNFSENFRDVCIAILWEGQSEAEWNFVFVNRDLQYSEEAHNALYIAFTKYKLKIASILLLHNLSYIYVG